MAEDGSRSQNEFEETKSLVTKKALRFMVVLSHESIVLCDYNRVKVIRYATCDY
jgi:hypothetical protein